MRIRNVSASRVIIGTLGVALNPQQLADINTLKAMASDELQDYINKHIIVIVSQSSSPATSPLDTFVGTESSVNLSPTQLTGLTGGADTTLHFHTTDRNRTNHTGTQLKVTISDFSHGSASHTGAIGTLSQVSDVTMTAANLNILDDGVDTSLHFHAMDRARANHTGTQLKATISDFAHDATSHSGAIGTLSQISDVTMSAANLNTLDDGVDTNLHFHATDRARANHTGTQLKVTISDFSHGAASHSGTIGTLSQINDVTVSASNLNNLLPQVGNTGSRPGSPTTGLSYFDTTLGKPIWWNGIIWALSDGTAA